MEICSPCQNRERVRIWVSLNKDRRKRHKGYGGTNESKRKWAKSEAGMENARKRTVAWYWRNPKRAREMNNIRAKKYYAEDNTKWVVRAMLRKKDIKQATPPWVDKDELFAIYTESKAITKETGIQHHVDHIVPLHGETVCGLNVPWNLRIITAEENLAKRNKLIPELVGE